MHRQKIIIAVLGFIFFFLLAYLIAAQMTLGFDKAVSSFIRSFSTPELDWLMMGITYTANWQSITLLCLVLLVLPATRISSGYLLAASSLLTTGLNNLLKQLFHRMRPEDVLPLVTHTSFSFPSGHAMSSFVFYGLILLILVRPLKKRPARFILTGFFVLLVFLIGVSRVYLGVHYPTDVLAGWSIGLCLLVLFEYAADRFTGKHVRNQGNAKI